MAITEKLDFMYSIRTGANTLLVDQMRNYPKVTAVFNQCEFQVLCKFASLRYMYSPFLQKSREIPANLLNAQVKAL